MDRMEPEEVSYDVWFEQHRAKEDVLRRQVKNPPAGGPLISVIVPAYHTPEAFFMEMVESVIAQSYERWELLIVDAGASAAESAKAKKKESRCSREQLSPAREPVFPKPLPYAEFPTVSA
jgi:cellulose synthase/poly-beta-1,6-N-acetylglucosamine synthase-like glycosyltransferase